MNTLCFINICSFNNIFTLNLLRCIAISSRRISDNIASKHSTAIFGCSNFKPARIEYQLGIPYAYNLRLDVKNISSGIVTSHSSNNSLTRSGILFLSLNSVQNLLVDL